MIICNRLCVFVKLKNKQRAFRNIIHNCWAFFYVSCQWIYFNFILEQDEAHCTAILYYVLWNDDGKSTKLTGQVETERCNQK